MSVTETKDYQLRLNPTAVTVITGHYGSGKTNFAMNLSLAYRALGKDVSLCDIDIVNPYFRSADFAPLCEQHGIHLITPPFANTNLDTPILTRQVDGAIVGGECVVLDVGGDDAGAVALGRYQEKITARESYQMILVVNQYRPLTATPEDVVAMIDDINRASKLSITHIVNNSNLGPDTSLEQIAASLDYGAKITELSGIPLLYQAIPRKLLDPICEGNVPDSRLLQLYEEKTIFPVDIFVKTPWTT